MLKKFFVIVNISLIASLSFFSSASAFSYPSPSRAASQILSSLGVNKDELRYAIQSLNVYRQKKNPPIVSISFYPPNPTEGMEVTVQATPSYFMNSAKDLYFTWFLKQSKCTDNHDADYKYKADCDLNDDGKVNIEDHKIKAMRIIANNEFNWEDADYSKSSDSDGYRAVYGGDDQRGKNERCYVHDTSTGDEHAIECEHLFPDAPGEKTGDNSFGRNEEEFWHTDPNADDTAHTGNVDEANVAGLGRSSFSWNFEQGDRVGVVVEGVSVEATQAADSSYRTMWAMPRSMCDIEAKINNYPKITNKTISETLDAPIAGQTTTVTRRTTESILSRAVNVATIRTTVVTTTTVTDSVTGTVISSSSTTSSSNSEAIFDTGDDSSVLTGLDSVEKISSDDISLKSEGEPIEKASDLNECLYDNLISPAENGPQSEKLDISLFYSPSSPINDPGSYLDPAESEGDELVVSASITNAKDNNYLQYSWEVFASNEANPDSWGDALLKSELPLSSQMVGLGLNTFKFKLNLPSPKKYLRVKLTVRENVGTNLYREGRESVVIPINSTTEQIKAYSALVSDSSLKLSLGADEICKDGMERAVCPVSKNEIIGVSVSSGGLSDFLWTIDGKAFVYQSCFFAGCDPLKQTNTAYLPVLKEIGERYTVGLTATNQITGAKVNLSRVFEVTDGEIVISSADESVCKPVLLGSYVDLYGQKWPDYSKINFWALTSSPIKLKASTVGFSISSDKYTWLIDGNTVDVSNAASFGFGIDGDGVLTLPPKLTGESYEVTTGAFYSQSNAVKLALGEYWNVPYAQLYEKSVSSSITVTMQDSAPATAQSLDKKIFAAVSSAMPAYLAFLLRIVLTAFLILFSSRLIMTFSLGKNEN